MPRMTKSDADRFFRCGPTLAENAIDDLERERRARASLTATLREQRLAKEEADRLLGADAKPARARARSGVVRSRQTS